MTTNAVKGRIRKFEEIGSVYVAPGRRRATEPAILEKVAFAIAEAATCSENNTLSSRSKIRALDIPSATMRIILRKILKLYSHKSMLKPEEHPACLEIALRFLTRIHIDEYW